MTRKLITAIFVTWTLGIAATQASAQTQKDYKEFGDAAPTMLMELYDLVLRGGAEAFQETCKDTFKGKLTGAEIPGDGEYGGRVAFQCKSRSTAGPTTIGVAFSMLTKQVTSVSLDFPLGSYKHVNAYLTKVFGPPQRAGKAWMFRMGLTAQTKDMWPEFILGRNQGEATLMFLMANTK
jgi:hypothetical protein